MSSLPSNMSKAQVVSALYSTLFIRTLLPFNDPSMQYLHVCPSEVFGFQRNPIPVCRNYDSVQNNGRLAVLCIRPPREMAFFTGV